MIQSTGTYCHVPVRADRLLQLDVAGWELWIWSHHPELPLELSDMTFCPVSPLGHSTVWLKKAEIRTKTCLCI